MGRRTKAGRLAVPPAGFLGTASAGSGGAGATRRWRAARSEARARRMVTAATAAYVANCLWGTAVAVRLIRTKKLRVVHHGLFVVTATLTTAAATTPLWTRSRSALFLLPALVPLAMAPRTNPRTGAHWRVAVAAAPSYLGALLFRR